MENPCKSMEEAMKHSLKAPRKRHLIHEGAHAPAFAAFSRHVVSQVLFLAL